MSYSFDRATLESSLARMHRSCNIAKTAADRLGEDGLWLDLQQMEVEITRLAEDSLRGSKRGPQTSRGTAIKGQLQIED
jgi:hypothetical protein